MDQTARKTSACSRCRNDAGERRVVEHGSRTAQLLLFPVRLAVMRSNPAQLLRCELPEIASPPRLRKSNQLRPQPPSNPPVRLLGPVPRARWPFRPALSLPGRTSVEFLKAL